MQNLDELKQKALDAISYFDIKEAKVIAKETEYQIIKLSESRGNDREEISELLGLLVRLKLLILPLLKDEEVEQLIKESAIGMISDPDLVLEERIEGRQLTVPESLRLEMVNQPIMEALRKNIEEIGDEKIFIVGSPGAEPPTTENWLLDYDRTYGTGPQKDLIWLDYVKKSVINARLSYSQADTLRKVIKLYEWLKREHKIE